MNAKLLAAAIVIALACAGGAYVFLGTGEEDREYTVSFDADGGSAPAPEPITAKDGKYVVLPLYSGTKEGYTFFGWTDGTSSYGTDKPYRVTKDVTLKADWAAAVTVSYDAAGGSAPAPEGGTFDAGETIVTATYTGTKDGALFVGWSDGTDRAGADSPYSLDRYDVTFTAVYTSDVIISFSLNGGSGALPERPVITGMQFTVPACTATRNGYDFAGWYDGSSLIDPGSTYTIVLPDISFTARWIPHTYSIVYELGGGTNAAGAPTAYTYGTPVNMDAYVPAKAGCIFNGWYSDSTFDTRVRTIGSSTFGDLTLYAYFETSLVGTGMTMEISGTEKTYWSFPTQRLVSTTEIAGTTTTDYTFYNYADGEMYFISRDTTLTVTPQGGTPTTTPYHSDEWTGSDDGYTWECDGTENLVNTKNYGQKNCYIVIGTKTNAIETVTETQYIGVSDGVVYKAVSHRVQSNIMSSDISDCSYDLVSTRAFDAEHYYSVKAYEDVGIRVSGDENRKTNDVVTLTAATNGSAAFKGWYDATGNILSTRSTYSPGRLLGNITVYARNTSEYGEIISAGDPNHSISSSIPLSNVEWNVKSIRTDTDGTGSTYAIPNVGIYTVTYSGDDPNGYRTYGSYTVFAEGRYSHTWTYGGEEHTVTLNILKNEYLGYRNDPTGRTRGSDAHMRSFVTFNDPHIVSLAQQFLTMSSSMSDIERLSLVLSYVQSIEYMLDRDFNGQEEYWKFALETVFDGCGDCEDTSILYCAIIKAMGYDTALMTVYASNTDVATASVNHAASMITGITGCESEQQFQKGGKTYYFCETTAGNGQAGHNPWNYLYNETITDILDSY